MAILTKTKLMISFALVLFAAVLLLSPKVKAAATVPDGLYSAHVMNDSSNPVYMQVRIDGNNVVLGAGRYSNDARNPQFQSCFRTEYNDPDSADGDYANSFTKYLNEFDINAMYATFKASTINDINGQPVTDTFPGAITEIAHGAFKDWKALTSVVVPSSIEVIGSDAFHSSGVTSVDLSQATNLVDMNSSTFNKCTNLQSIDLSNTKIKTLGTSVFLECTALSSVKLPDTLTTIDQTAFKDTYNLTQLTIPPNVTNIHKAAFEDYSSSPKTKILKFTGDFDSSFHGMAVNTNTYVKLLYPAGNPTWENSSLVQKLVSSGKAASYITTTTTTTPQTPPDDVIYSAERTSTANGVYTFSSSGPYSAFTGIWINGSAIPSSYYKAEPNADGGVSITFTNSYARTLTSSEEYLLHFVFNGGFGILNFTRDEVATMVLTQENSSNSVDNFEPASEEPEEQQTASSEEPEEQQTVSSEIEDTSQTQAPTSSSEAIDTVQEQGEEQSGNAMVILIAVLAIVCICGGVLIFVKVRKNK